MACTHERKRTSPEIPPCPVSIFFSICFLLSTYYYFCLFSLFHLLPCPLFVSILRAQEVYAGLGGTARAPTTGAPLSSDDGDGNGNNGMTHKELEEEVRREAAAGEGRRAVAVLLQRMLSSARYDRDFLWVVWLRRW